MGDLIGNTAVVVSDVARPKNWFEKSNPGVSITRKCL
jgi:hypothetical protein